MENRYFYIVLLVLITTGALAQTAPAPPADPDAKDKSEIRFLAKKRIESDLQGLYNTLTFEDVGDYERVSVIKNSYLPNANQVFYSDDVIIEDDLDPKQKNATEPKTAKDWKVDAYLGEFELKYVKTTSETIKFSNLQVSTPERKDSYYEVRVFFTSKFGGIYGRNQKTKAYYESSTSRVATLRADKIDGKWQVLITQILFLRSGQTLNKPAPAVVAATTPAVIPTVAATTPIATTPVTQKPDPTPPRTQPAPKSAATTAKAAAPGELIVGGAEQEFYQSADNTPVWFKWDLKAMQVVRSESAQLPAGFFRRGGEKGKFTYYASDSSRMVVQHKDTIRYRPAGNSEISFLRRLMVKPAPTLAATAPASIPQSRADSPLPTVAFKDSEPTTKSAAELPKPTLPTTTTLVAAKPIDKPAAPTVNAPTFPAPMAGNTTKPATGSTLAAPTINLTLPPTSRVTTAGPVAKPTPAVAPALSNSLKAEQARMVKRYRTQGWLQLVAGVAGLVGGYLTYSSLQSDYGTYKARVEKVNSEYDIWREVSRQPAGQRLDPISFNSYASPGIFAAYGAGLVGAGLAANGVLRFGKAKKVKKQVWK